jgi:hypothetical protein
MTLICVQVAFYHGTDAKLTNTNMRSTHSHEQEMTLFGVQVAFYHGTDGKLFYKTSGGGSKGNSASASRAASSASKTK